MKHTSTRPCAFESEPLQEIPEAKALSFLKAIDAAITRPEHGANGRSTTVYYAELDMAGKQLQVSSSAIPREMLLELSSDCKATESLRSKAAGLLSAGYHVWAHELQSLAEAFNREFGMHNA